MKTEPRLSAERMPPARGAGEMASPPLAPEGSGHDQRVLLLLIRFTVGHRRWFLIALLMLVLEAVMSVFKAYPIAYLIDFLKGSRGALWFPWISDPRIATIALLTTGLVLFAVFDSLGDSLAEVYLARGGRSLGYTMRVTLYAHLQRLSLAFHSRRKTGDMLKRITSDIEDVEEFVIDSLSDIAGSVLVLIGTLSFLLFQSWQVAVLAAVLVPVLSLVSNHFSQRITATSRRQKSREADLASAAHEMLTAVPVVQTLGQSDYEQRRFEDHSTRAMQAALEAVGLEARFSWVVGVLEAVTISAIVWLGVWLVDREGITVGTLVLFVILIQNMFKPTRRIIKEWTTIGKIRASVERVAEVLARPPAVRDRSGAVEAPPFEGRIEFRNVNFSYRPDPEDVLEGDEVPAALEDVSFQVDPGEIVALVGHSGAGKSTIAQLIPRLYDPLSGEVLIDGRDVKTFSLDSLRRQVSIVLQETVLFHGSVAHNIGYGRPDATRRDIVVAAARANADEFIGWMAGGFDAELDERAANLSGGQRQRISIARALVRDTPILILDEPTTGLDTASSAVVMQGLRQLMEGKTTIVISHDPSLIRAADRILVIKNGHLEEEGTHDELLRTGGHYASLYVRTLTTEPGGNGDRP
jgi:ABC-type multidrug transport system fused ATPase/permease subunit